MDKENNETLMIFDVFIDTQSQPKNFGISRTEFWIFVLKNIVQHGMMEYTSKTYKIVMKHIFMIKNIGKKQ